jgi:DNA-binding MarR family transcriptional regulator
MSATNLHELDAPPWRRLDSTILSVSSDIRALYDERFAALELSLSLASLLAYLGDFGPVSQTRAADHLKQGRAVTGSQIDRLEKRGLLERLPDANDRRVWLVKLTDSGEELVKKIIDIDETVRAELRNGVSREERQLLASLLLRLQSNIATARMGETEPKAPHPTHNGDTNA